MDRTRPDTYSDDRIEDAYRTLGDGHATEVMYALRGEPRTVDDLHDALDVDRDALEATLDRLDGLFLTRDGDEWNTRPSGFRLFQTMVTAVPTDPVAEGAFELDGDCLDCGATVEAEYVDGYLRIGCGACDAVYHDSKFPVGGASGRSRADLVRAFDRRMRANESIMTDGVCPDCRGIVENTVEGDGDDAWIHHVCTRCDTITTVTVGEHLVSNPLVVAFFRDRGVDLGDAHTWEIPFCFDDDLGTVESTDPLRLSATLECDGDVLELILDGDLSVVDRTVHVDGRAT